MLETDFILMMTAGFLLAPEKAIDKMIADFEAPYELTEIRKPGRVSIGALSGTETLAWKKWIEGLRSGGVTALSVTYFPDERSGLATHIAAAFAGVISYVLEVEIKQGKKAWYLNAENSRRSAITAARFADFIESQPGKIFLWQRIHFLINESNGLNNRPPVAEGETAEYLHSTAGEAIFDFNGENLLSEIQIESEINNMPLSFPPEFDSFFDPPYDRSVFFPAEKVKEPVYFYLLGEVTAASLDLIISAQPFAATILPAVNNLLKDENPATLNGITDAETLLMTGANDQLQVLGNVVCRAIAAYCQENDLLPVIPAALAEIFGPDETDQRRARARGHTSTFRVLKPPENPWRYYQFEPLSVFTSPGTGQNQEETDEAFRNTLAAIQSFAEKQQLTFYAGIFRLAALLLSPDSVAGPFTAENITDLVKDNGLPEELITTLTDSIYYVTKMLELQWPKTSCFGLLAVSLTNVFGGMGSWNDMSFEAETETYNKVSADFFLARERFFALMLSGKKTELTG